MGAVGDTVGQGDAAGESAGTDGKRHATLRCGAASLSATARRAQFTYHGRAAGEGAR
ncbi:DUF6380 family protein [Streptomyces sp. NPDC005820]|uniref:DUF6380 family protein n=1 Tax=Streptomyces sp. NPDC005820 TaxID=3157069 RepID=UPI0033C99E7A